MAPLHIKSQLHHLTDQEVVDQLKRQRNQLAATETDAVLIRAQLEELIAQLVQEQLRRVRANVAF